MMEAPRTSDTPTGTVPCWPGWWFPTLCGVQTLGSWYSSSVISLLDISSTRYSSEPHSPHDIVGSYTYTVADPRVCPPSVCPPSGPPSCPPACNPLGNNVKWTIWDHPHCNISLSQWWMSTTRAAKTGSSLGWARKEVRISPGWRLPRLKTLRPRMSAIRWRRKVTQRIKERDFKYEFHKRK